jgi:hypothetical protein
MERRHLEYFRLEPSERRSSIGKEVLSEMVALWERVRERLSAEDSTWLGEIHAPDHISKTDDHAWAQCRHAQGEEAVNLTLELRSGEFSVNVVGWTKPQASRLTGFLRGKDAKQFWREHPDLDLCIFVRQGPVFLGAEGKEVGRYGARKLVRPGFVILRMDHKKGLNADQLLAFHIRRFWPAEATLGSPDPWLGEVATATAALIPVAKAANTYEP